MTGIEIPRGEGGRGSYLTLHCHHQNDSALTEMGIDEIRFNVSLTVRGKLTRQCPQFTVFEENGSGIKPRSFRLQLGQTGSPHEC